jgi:hypothetical protein
MPRHWLDANVFIEPKNGPYAFDIVPGYWSWIERQAKIGVVASPMAVFKELVNLERRTDDLAKWAQAVKDALFVEAEAEVQKRSGEIGNYVQRNYEAAHVAEFMRGADPWIVAHASVDKGTVVTIEAIRNTKRIKIPNVCAHFGVPWCNHLKMLRSLGASFVEDRDE